MGKKTYYCTKIIYHHGDVKVDPGFPFPATFERRYTVMDPTNGTGRIVKIDEMDDVHTTRPAACGSWTGYTVYFPSEEVEMLYKERLMHGDTSWIDIVSNRQDQGPCGTFTGWDLYWQTMRVVIRTITRKGGKMLIDLSLIHI